MSYENTDNEARLLNLNDIVIIQNKDFSFIKINSKNRLKIKRLLLVSIEVAINNLSNVNTTEYKDGTPYKPFVIKVDKNLNYTIELDDKTTWIYDPSHPLAKVSGEKVVILPTAKHGTAHICKSLYEII